MPILNRAALLLSSCSILAYSATAGETEWPQFRGPTGQGISAAVNVPIQWDAGTHVTWKVDTQGKGWSSPVLSQGKLYFTSAVSPAGGETTLHAYCYRAADGQLLWDTEIFQPDPANVAAMHRKNSPASATPIISNGRIYVHFGHMGTAALDLEGKVIWRQSELKYAPQHGNGGSPTLVGDELIYSADGNPEPFVIALDAATGALRWKTPRNTTAKKLFSFCTPLAISVDGQPEVISPGSGFVGAYDPQSGAEIWRVGYGEGYSVVPRPIYSHGLLFLSSGFDSPTLYAIKPEGAKGDATATNVAWSRKKAAPLTPSMVVVGDELYSVSDNGIATCADAVTGNVYWSERLGGDFSASIVAAEGRLYCQNETGKGFVLKAGKTFELLSTNDLAERTLASYAVADGAIYIRSEDHLWKIGQ